MNKIKTLSKCLSITMKGLIIGYPLLIMFIWANINSPFIKHFIERGWLFNPLCPPATMLIEWSLSQKMIGLLSSFIYAIPFILSFTSLKCIFENYQKNSIFTVFNAKHYTYLGYYFFIKAMITNPIEEAILTYAATFNNPPGQKLITISAGTPTLESLFYGSIIILIGWVMKEAAKLQEEQALTV